MPLIERVLNLIRYEHPHHQFDIVSKGMLPEVKADATKTELVLLNLLLSAVRRCPDGGYIGIQVERNGLEVIVSVVDNGETIPVKLLDKAFWQFYPVDDIDGKMPSTYKLGLYTTKQFVELQNGLLIDDDAVVLKSLAAPLREEGYQVYTAQDGPAGLDIAREKYPDLVVLDLVLPRMNGFETSQRLHELGVQSILVMGPGNDERSVVKSLEMGADDYLPKPIEVPILLAKIRMLMRRNNQQIPGKPPTYDDGKLLIDLDNRRVELDSQPVKLTRTEFRLLSILLHRVGRVVTHEDLIREVWGTEKETSLGSLKLYIHYLRQNGG
jgi:two-component system KDP operon response regulator KdpE